MQSGRSLFCTDIDTVVHQTGVTSRFNQINFSGCWPRSVGVVTGQQPNSYRKMGKSDEFVEQSGRKLFVITWPEPITSWHFSADLNTPVLE